MVNKLDVVTFGETMVLFQTEQMLPFEYVHQFNKQIGGAESNVAIGLQRLGHSVGWFSKLGNDSFGRYLLHFLRGEGLDTSSCLFTDEGPTGLLFKERLSPENLNVYYYRKNSAASFLSPDDIDEDYIAGAKYLHVTGITPALSESCKQAVFKAIEIAKKHGVKIVFDPNLRLKLWAEEEAKKVFKEIVELADIILPGMDEGEFITGETTPEAVAEALSGTEPKTVIIKLGEKGAFYKTPEASGYVEGFPVKQVVDPVGAGDGFAAGIISGLLKKEPMEEVVRKANAIGAIVVGVSGDIEGLPRLEDVNRFMSGSAQRDVMR